MRTYATWLAVAAMGGILGWVDFASRPPGLIPGTCSAAPTYPYSGVLTTPCVVPSNPVIPFDLGAGLESILGGAFFALAIAAVIWIFVIEPRQRHRAA